MDKQELRTLQMLDAIAREESVRAMIGLAVSRAEQKLAHSLRAPLAWEPMPLATYGGTLPNMICSSWVFILRAQTRTGAERHPNSHQRMMSYRGSGDLQTWTDESVPSNEGKGWCSNPLVSDPEARIESRWVSIPPNIWHQAVVPEENWVVVSFHTVAEGELMEERPDAADTELTHQRRYMEHYA